MVWASRGSDLGMIAGTSVVVSGRTPAGQGAGWIGARPVRTPRIIHPENTWSSTSANGVDAGRAWDQQELKRAAVDEHRLNRS
jgi:hypothetical protein